MSTEYYFMQVLVLTAVKFLHILQKGLLTLNQVNLLLFDECHYTTDDHEYGHIMRFYTGLESPPRILGLTTSVLNDVCKTPQELENHLSNLERILCSTAETSTDNLVTDIYSAQPKEVLIDCADYSDTTGLVDEFQAILQESIDFIDDLSLPFDSAAGETDPRHIPRTAFTECGHVLRALGPWCCGKVAGLLGKQVMKICEHEVGEWPRRLLQYALTQLSVIDHVMTDVFDKQVMSMDDFLCYMSPRVQQLIDILHGYKPDDNFMIVGSTGIDFSMVTGMDSFEDDDKDNDDDDDSMKFSDDDDDEFEEEPIEMKTDDRNTEKANKESKVDFAFIVCSIE